MTKKPAIFMLSLGIACALAAIVLALDLGGASILLPKAATAIWGFVGYGVALIACGGFDFARKPTQAELIEQSDERNAAINGQAALHAFVTFCALAPITGLVLYASDQLSIGGYTALIVVEVLAAIVYFVQIGRFQKTM